MALAVTLVAASMLPSTANSRSNTNGEVVKPRSFVNFVYLAAFCTHVGAQFWMTFISGERQNKHNNIILMCYVDLTCYRKFRRPLMEYARIYNNNNNNKNTSQYEYTSFQTYVSSCVQTYLNIYIVCML